MNNQSHGRTGNRLLQASLTEMALSIIREHYSDFRPAERQNVVDAALQKVWQRCNVMR